MKRIFFIVLAAMAIGAGVYFYWIPQQNAAQVAATAPHALPATTPPSPVRRSADVFVMGLVVPVRHTHLSTSTAGHVIEVAVKEGDAVEAGDVLLRLDNELQQIAVTQAEAQLRIQQAEYAKLSAGVTPQEITIAETAVEIAEATLTRIEDETPRNTATAMDSAVSKTVAEAELRRAEAELELLESGARAEELEAAAAAIAAAEADLQQKQLELAAAEIRAPYDGTVAAISVQVGNQVVASEPVIQFADMTAWQVTSNELHEINAVSLEIGDKAAITFDAIPDLELTGTLVHMRPVGDINDGAVTYTVVIAPDDWDPRIRWNMTAQILFNTGQ